MNKRSGFKMKMKSYGAGKNPITMSPLHENGGSSRTATGKADKNYYKRKEEARKRLAKSTIEAAKNAPRDPDPYKNKGVFVEKPKPKVKVEKKEIPEIPQRGGKVGDPFVSLEEFTRRKEQGVEGSRRILR